jgi:hypothetical protein
MVSLDSEDRRPELETAVLAPTPDGYSMSVTPAPEGEQHRARNRLRSGANALASTHGTPGCRNSQRSRDLILIFYAIG